MNRQNNSNDFAQLQTRGQQIHETLKTDIRLANSDESHARVQAFIGARYQDYFPEIMPDESNHYQANSFVFYHQDARGDIQGCASLMVDSDEGFSEEALFSSEINHYRSQGLKCLQIGRLVIETGQSPCQVGLKDYFRLFYQFSTQLGYDVIIGLVKQKDLGFHQKLLGATVLCPDTRIDYGSGHVFAVAAWQLNALKPKFFEWIQYQPETTETAIYHPQEWEAYARAFAAVQTSFQRDLQLASAEWLNGDVADFGCGSAKLAPFLADMTQVSSYIGIDYSHQMIEIANWLIDQFDCPTFTTYEGKIEHYRGKTFDSAVSLNSYYTWPDPLAVLKHIYALLNPGGRFVLATPNPGIDMLAMEKEARKELLTHPDFATFKQSNLALTANPDAQFITMDAPAQTTAIGGF